MILQSIYSILVQKGHVCLPCWLVVMGANGSFVALAACYAMVPLTCLLQLFLGLKMGARGNLHFSTKCPRVSPLLIMRPGCKCMICSSCHGLCNGTFALSLVTFYDPQKDSSKYIPLLVQKHHMCIPCLLYVLGAKVWFVVLAAGRLVVSLLCR